jgi:hypothetical protein
MDNTITIAIRIIVGFIAYIVVSWRAAKLLIRMCDGNRSSEWPSNKKTEPPSKNELKWEIVHIRDDVGGIAGLLSLIAGLIAAILAVLVVR